MSQITYKVTIIDLAMSFDLKQFISTPTVEELSLLKKFKLFQLAQHYKLTADNSVSKTQIKEVVLQYLHRKNGI